MTGYPLIIQGGMGVAVSDWRLARAVSSEGQLGVVSGAGVDAVLVRRLQLGDPGGHMRAALDAFPIPGVVDDIVDRYFIEGGKAPGAPFKKNPMGKRTPSRRLEDLLVVANFAEVWLAKQGHGNPVGINYLEKIQAPTLQSLYGAVLGGVDYVLIGAGIPRAIPPTWGTCELLTSMRMARRVGGVRGNQWTTTSARVATSVTRRGASVSVTPSFRTSASARSDKMVRSNRRS